MAKKGGYIKVPRSSFEIKYIFKTNRRYTNPEALIDLIALARYSDSPKEWVDANGEIVLIYKNQFAGSSRFLAKRWKWGNATVMKFLKVLESNGIIKREVRSGGSIITIMVDD